MTNSSTTYSTTLRKLLSLAAVAILAAGCATGTATAPLPLDASQLEAAGFKVLEAKTTLQQERLQRLAPGKFRAVQRNGVHFYLYPDQAQNRIFVGTDKEYKALQQLQPGKFGDLQAQLNAQTAANLSAYAKQDTAMTQASQRDLSDPFFGLGWPTFDELYW